MTSVIGIFSEKCDQCWIIVLFFFSSRRRHTRCALVTGVQTCALPIYDIGPGVYDIHSPRVPDTVEMVALMSKAVKRIAADRLWVNPDCGLKTRAWPETEAALVNMVAAARQLRSQ